MPSESFVKAKNLEDLVVYHKAQEAAHAVSALLKRSAFSSEYKLKDQLDRSSGSVAPLIAEGFGQLTDRHLATYLGRARGSALETQAHLARARDKRCISDEERVSVDGRYVEICKMLTPWINYLEQCGWKNRGIRPDSANEDAK
jgi:four helix bundle protein